MTMTSAIAPSEEATTDVPSRAPVSRRHILAGAAALGAASLLPDSGVRGQSARARVIDTHHHFYPPDYQKAWLDWEDARKIPHFANQVGWTQAIETLRKMGLPLDDLRAIESGNAGRLIPRLGI
jgi:hypothetical protein